MATKLKSVGDELQAIDAEAAAKMRIWNAVCKTDPKHTKKVNQRGGFTAIDAQYQIMEATRQFGPLGEGWGYNVGDYQLVGNLIVVPVTLWHSGDRNKAFGPVLGCAEMLGNRPDRDAPKKAVTDAITKGLSQLGFNADVFLGLFDDNKYVAEVTAEFSPKPDNAGTGEDAPRKTRLDGPYDTTPKLEKAAREFVKTLRGFSTLAEFDEWKQDKEVLAFVEQCKRDLPGWWFANRADNPPDFTPLAVEVHQTRIGLHQARRRAEPRLTPNVAPVDLDDDVPY
jgi:hypothetical protein